MATPGSSPSVLVSTTPAASARALRMGPSVESSSAFTMTVCLPCSMASSVSRGAEVHGAGDFEHDVDAAGFARAAPDRRSAREYRARMLASAAEALSAWTTR